MTKLRKIADRLACLLVGDEALCEAPPADIGDIW
jgi:hypothetical protein